MTREEEIKKNVLNRLTEREVMARLTGKQLIGKFKCDRCEETFFSLQNSPACPHCLFHRPVIFIDWEIRDEKR